MNHSNATIRTRTIWKAVLLTILPMVFSALAVYLFLRTDGLYEQKYNTVNAEMQVLSKERADFIAILNQMNANWKNYRVQNSKFIRSQDSTSLEGMKIAIDESGTIVLQNLSPMQLTTRDSIYLDFLASSRENFDDYLKDMRKFRRFKERIDTGLSGGQCCEDMEAYEEQMENEIEELKEEIAELRMQAGQGGIDNSRLQLCQDRNRGLKEELEDLEEELNKKEKKVANKFLQALSNYKGRKLKDEVITSIIEDLELKRQ
ncbi:MAG: hypothetical protein AAF849_03515 [Bacteroidota bacterium]